MNNENILQNEIELMKQNGSKFDLIWLNEIKEELLSSNYDEVMEQIILEITEATVELINTGLLSGISTKINLPNVDINVYGGYSYYKSDEKIDENTLFDIASITKFFTLLLTLKLEELGYLSLDNVIYKYSSDFKLKDFTIDDLLKMVGLIKTPKRIDECCNFEEAYQVLKEIEVISNDKEKNKYTDMGLIVLGFIIEEIVSKRLNKKMTFSEIMNYFLIQPLGLKKTTFYPSENTAGNGVKSLLPHDKKSQVLGPIGSAGLFSNSDDLNILSSKISDYLNYYHLSKLNYKVSSYRSLGYAGVNLKHEEGIKKTFAPKEYSKFVYAHQGFTGCVLINDPLYQIHNNFLISTIKENENKKPDLFMEEYNKYQLKIVKETLKLLLFRKINNYENVKKVIKLS